MRLYFHRNVGGKPLLKEGTVQDVPDKDEADGYIKSGVAVLEEHAPKDDETPLMTDTPKPASAVTPKAEFKHDPKKDAK